MRVLLTGFEPFGGSNLNSSWEVAARIGQLVPEGVNIEVRQLPVSFVRAGEMIRELLADHKPDVLLMLGQRGNGQSIDIERIAVNLMDSVHPDHDGECPQEQIIRTDGKSAYFSNLPVKDLKDALLQKNIPAKVSNSAGLYVCNCVYYQALSYINEREMHTKAIFIHLPKIAEVFTLERITTSVTTIIENIKDL